LYPNPASTTFSVEAALEPALVEVYNLAGQKAAAYPANGAQTFGVSVLKTGVYVVKVTFTNGKVATQKLIKGTN
ncbi:MAG: T9SS type A sorting domain-containing protein, partial [Prevotellaceae bacterium]|nr:T9SS type A sorting domain-containing protein [Prevotellaceae bacterium]